MTWLWLLAVPLAWLWMNHEYGRVYGRTLRWPYFWAAQGALLFGFRLPRWETAPASTLSAGKGF